MPPMHENSQAVARVAASSKGARLRPPANGRTASGAHQLLWVGVQLLGGWVQRVGVAADGVEDGARERAFDVAAFRERWRVCRER